VADDTHLWAETYNREMKDVFEIQEEISQAVVENLKVALLKMSEEPLVKDYTKNTVAYELFLKARFCFNKGISGYQKAIEYYEKTIKTDPNYVPAYTHLAETYTDMGAVRSLPPWEMAAKINALIQRAYEIDDKYTYVSMGINKMLRYEWQEAERCFKRALEMNPGYVNTHHGYAVYLSALGRLDEAIKSEECALELDPLSSWFRYWLGWYECCSRNFNKAIEISQETLDLDPNNPWVSSVLGRAYGGKGLYDKAISIVQRFEEVPYLAAVLGYLYGKAGNKEKAQETVNSFLARSNKGYFSPYMIALVYAGLGEKDEVFEWLDSAYEVRDHLQVFLKGDIAFHSFHSDPSWAEHMRKRGLPD
jgi:tetratricopeptide (TPR) repeat protein